MMRSTVIIFFGTMLLRLMACSDDFDNEVIIPDFNLVSTVDFKEKLSDYNIYQGSPVDLIHTNEFHLLELSSTLFTDYARKQRLVKVPQGTQITNFNNETVNFPNGTILVKTFFYYLDERNHGLGKRVIESRLLIKDNDIWNVATYLWNEEQSDAILQLDGFDTQVSWTNDLGTSQSTIYHVPSQNECFTCHQSNSTLTPLGPTLRNLNRSVLRNGEHIGQISHLQALSILSDIKISELPTIVDYNDEEASLSERARAYLAMNCSHCHNPSGWEVSNDRDFDFRYEVPLAHTGILSRKEKIARTIITGRMPFIGTTVMDEEGVSLIIKYLESL